MKIIKIVKVFPFSIIKINIDLIKTFPNLLTAYFIDSMNFNTEFASLMRFCLMQGYKRMIGVFLHPGKSHSQNGKSDSTTRILTLTEGHETLQGGNESPLMNASYPSYIAFSWFTGNYSYSFTNAVSNNGIFQFWTD